MGKYFDELETCNHDTRKKSLFGRLPDFLTTAIENCPAWKQRMGDLQPQSINSPHTLATIPVLRKDELMNAQAQHPPFGGFANETTLSGTRYFMSPGPVWEPQPPGLDPWLGARAFHAVGIGRGDLVHCALSFHQTPGGFILDAGARAAGANVFPAGIGATQQQVEAAATLKPTAYAGTPDYLKTMLEKAAEMGKDISSITKALVSGGALFPSLREEYAQQGIVVLQCYATADLGVIAYETEHQGKPVPGMIVNEDLIVEIVRPGTDDPVEQGEVGELVVTNFNTAYPLIRFGTGDLSAAIAEPSPCGRTNMRIKGWMGRADQRTKIKGMFVDPKQIAGVVKSSPGIKRARLVVSRQADTDVMTLLVEPKSDSELDTTKIAAALTAATKLKGGVEISNDLPNDGKVIDDTRDYSK